MSISRNSSESYQMKNTLWVLQHILREPFATVNSNTVFRKTHSSVVSLTTVHNQLIGCLVDKQHSEEQSVILVYPPKYFLANTVRRIGWGRS